MDYEIIYSGKVVEGELVGIPRKKLRSELKMFEGKAVDMVIRKKKKNRSVEQNRTWWMYMNILSSELGYDKDQMHEICKFKFLKTEAVNEKTGEVFEYIQSTTKLSTVDFMGLIEQLYRWSSETFGIVLPVPNQQIKIDLS